MGSELSFQIKQFENGVVVEEYLQKSAYDLRKGEQVEDTYHNIKDQKLERYLLW